MQSSLVIRKIHSWSHSSTPNESPDLPFFRSRSCDQDGTPRATARNALSFHFAPRTRFLSDFGLHASDFAPAPYLQNSENPGAHREHIIFASEHIIIVSGTPKNTLTTCPLYLSTCKSTPVGHKNTKAAKTQKYRVLTRSAIQVLGLGHSQSSAPFRFVPRTRNIFLEPKIPRGNH